MRAVATFLFAATAVFAGTALVVVGVATLGWPWLALDALCILAVWLLVFRVLS